MVSTKPRVIAVLGSVGCALALLVHCGGARRDEAADGGAASDGAVGKAEAAVDARAGQCRPDGGNIRLTHPEAVGPRCTGGEACPDRGTCTELSRLDAGYDGGFCVAPHPCAAVTCPACTECEWSGPGGIPQHVGCAPLFGPESLVSKPDRLAGTCRASSDCAAGEVCVDLSGIEASYTEPRCARVELTACEVVWCSSGTACGCSAGIGTQCTPATSDPVRLFCRAP